MKWEYLEINLSTSVKIFIAKDVSSGAGIIYLLAMDAHVGGKMCSGLTDVMFATVISSKTVQ